MSDDLPLVLDMQIALDGQQIDELAIRLIQAYEPLAGYYLGFSGGKDSVVIYDLAVRSGVKFDAHYNVSPIDPPDIHQFIKEHYPAVAWDYGARGFFGEKGVLRHGAPSPRVRWCCEYIKEGGGKGRVKMLGMRRDESTKRSGYTCFRQRDSSTFWLLPIVGWSEADVWQYIAERNLPTCELYRQGFKRLGCVLCPFAGKVEVKLSLTLFPRLVLCWRQALDRYFDTRIERGSPLPFESKDAFWAWWIKR